MKKDITIGEFANLMDVSTHQIRYFEEKGILLPSYVDENGYRMYGIDQIYALSHILLLRRLKISVSDIKKQFSTFSPDDYMGALEKSVTDIEKQIKDLHVLKDMTKRIIKKAKTGQEHLNVFSFKSIPERPLTLLEKNEVSFSFDARGIYNLLYQSKKTENVFSSDFITLIDESHLYFCLESSHSKDFILKEGSYLSYHFLIKEKKDLENGIAYFFEHAKSKQIRLEGHLIKIENSDLAMFYNDHLLIELQMRIGDCS